MDNDNKHTRNKSSEYDNLGIMNNSENRRSVNESIFSFRYLNLNRDYSKKNIRLNNKFFECEFNEVIENVKEVSPDTYFKHKLDIVKNNIEDLKSKYKSKANIILLRKKSKNIFAYNKANILISILSLIILTVSIVLYFYYFGTNIPRAEYILMNLLTETSNIFICVTSVSIISLVIIFYLNHKNSEYSNTNDKLIAEKCIKEIENILKQNEKGSLLDIDYYSKLYCEDNNFKLNQFNNTILKYMKEFISSDDTNLCEVIYNNIMYLKLI